MRRPLPIAISLLLGLGLTVPGGGTHAATGDPEPVSARSSSKGTIAGKLTTVAGTGVDDIRAAAYRYDPTDLEEGPWVFWSYDYSNAAGNYEITGLEPGTYRVQFYDVHSYEYAEEYWDDASWIETADDIEVGANQHVTGKDAVLTVGGSISGVVTTSQRPRSQWLWVSVYQRNAAGSYEFYDTTTAHDNPGTPAFDGAYMLYNLPAGTYRVQFEGDDEFIDQYWNDKPTLAAADDIVLAAGQVVTGKNAHLVAPTPPISNDETPSISGSPAVGSTLTATTGWWSPTPTSIAYEWLVDDAVVVGATTSTFVPRLQDIGKSVQVRVTASKNGYLPGIATSEPTAAVTEGSMSNTALPAVSGKPAVGATLSATAGSWSPAPASTSFAWLVGGVPVPDATQSTFSPRAQDVGRSVAVRVTAGKPGYGTATATSVPTQAVTDDPVMQNTALPTISGAAKVGETLTVSPGSWTPDASQFNYRWFVDGVAVPSEISTTYVVRVADLGKTVSAEVVANHSGHLTGIAMSEPTSAVALGTRTNTTPPNITGSFDFDDYLFAAWGAWTTNPTNATFQWLLDGVPVGAETDQSGFQATAAMVGRKLSVRVTVTSPGYAAATATSIEHVVPPSTIRVDVAPYLMPCTCKVGSSVRIDRGSYLPYSKRFRFTLQWYADGKRIKNPRSSKVLLRLTDKHLGKRIHARVTVSAPGYRTRVFVTAPTKPIKAPKNPKREARRAGSVRAGV